MNVSSHAFERAALRVNLDGPNGHKIVEGANKGNPSPPEPQ